MSETAEMDANAFPEEETRLTITAEHYSMAMEKPLETLNEILMSLPPAPHGYNQEYVGFLAYRRFRAIHDAQALDLCINYYRESLAHTPDTHSTIPRRQEHCALALADRARMSGNINDLISSTEYQVSAISRVPLDYPDLHGWIGNLALTYRRHFQLTGDKAILDNAVERISTLAKSFDVSNNHYFQIQQHLAEILLVRFQATGHSEDFSSANQLVERILSELPSNHPTLPMVVYFCAMLKSDIFKASGDAQHLKDAVNLLIKVQAMVPEGHPMLAEIYNTLGATMGELYKKIGNQEFIERSAAYFESIVQEFPTYPGLPKVYANLGATYSYLYQASDDLQYINQAINAFEKALDDLHHDPISWLETSGHLAVSLLARVTNTFQQDDLNRASDIIVNVCSKMPDGSATKFTFYGYACSIFLHRFKETGDHDYLNKAINYGEDAISSMIPTSSDYLFVSMNLGLCYGHRFNVFHNVSDVIEFQKHSFPALQNNLISMPNFSSMCISVGTLLLEKVDSVYHDNSDINNLDACLKHAFNTQSQSTLASAWCFKGDYCLYLYKKNHKEEDCYSAIEAFQNALQLMDPNNSQYPTYMQHLGIAYIHAYEISGDTSLVPQALEVLSNSVVPHQYKQFALAGNYGNLAKFYQMLYNDQTYLDLPENIENIYCALYFYGVGSQLQHSFSSNILTCARDWARLLGLLGLSECIKAYTIALGTIPQLVFIGGSIADRYNLLVQKKIPDLVEEAAKAAIKFGKLETAVEFLEQGLAITQKQLFYLRDQEPLLKDMYPDLATSLYQVSSQLDLMLRPSMTNKGGNAFQLAFQRDQIIKTIREKDGFHNFMMPKSFSQISISATNGPVILLTSTFALVIYSTAGNYSVFVVHLPDSNQNLIFEAICQIYHNHDQSQSQFQSQSRDTGTTEIDEICERAGRINRERKSTLSPITRAIGWLSKTIGQPIYQFLQQHNLDNGRIWWCLYGATVQLPIHATLIDFSVIQSYTLTLDFLIQARKKVSQNTIQAHKLATIGVTNSSHTTLPPLLGVQRELKLISNTIGDAYISSILDMNATVDKAVSILEVENWFHFACHGVQDPESPFNSSLILYDGNLTFKKIYSMDLKDSQFIFLSACQTATIGSWAPTEFVHIAGAFAAVGFPSVIATLWNISDSDVPVVAKAFYGHVYKDGKGFDLGSVAEGLANATRELKKFGGNKESWVPFIHIGV